MGLFEWIGVGKEVGNALASPVEAVGEVLDELCTSDEERAQAAIMMQKLQANQDLLQSKINLVEAKDKRFFNSGWRPAVGWVIALTIFLQFPVNFILSWINAFFSLSLTTPSLPGFDTLITILIGMLGMSGMRSWERAKGLIPKGK